MPTKRPSARRDTRPDAPQLRARLAGGGALARPATTTTTATAGRRDGGKRPPHTRRHGDGDEPVLSAVGARPYGGATIRASVRSTPAVNMATPTRTRRVSARRTRDTRHTGGTSGTSGTSGDGGGESRSHDPGVRGDREGKRAYYEPHRLAHVGRSREIICCPATRTVAFACCVRRCRHPCSALRAATLPHSPLIAAHY